MGRTETLLCEIREEFPAFRIVPKRESALQRAIAGALWVVTLGGQRTYLTEYYTVLGNVLYVPDGWTHASDASLAIILRHERIHLRQLRRYSWPGMALLYLVPWFPIGLAYGRARLEWEAYRETLRATAEYHGPAAARDPALRRQIVRRFVGGAYGFMWPFPRTIHRWLDEALADLGPPERPGIPHV